jgi:hypothetical protein
VTRLLHPPLPVYMFCRECGEVPVEVRPWDLEPRICGHCAADRVRKMHARRDPSPLYWLLFAVVTGLMVWAWWQFVEAM